MYSKNIIIIIIINKQYEEEDEKNNKIYFGNSYVAPVIRKSNNLIKMLKCFNCSKQIVTIANSGMSL